MALNQKLIYNTEYYSIAEIENLTNQKLGIKIFCHETQTTYLLSNIGKDNYITVNSNTNLSVGDKIQGATSNATAIISNIDFLNVYLKNIEGVFQIENINNLTTSQNNVANISLIKNNIIGLANNTSILDSDIFENKWVGVLGKHVYRNSQENIYYISKSGNDNNNGLTIESAFKTFNKTLTEINSKNPSIENQFSVYCFDSGVYDEDIIVKDYIHLFCSNAILKGQCEILDNSSLYLNKQIVNNGEIGIFRNSTNKKLQSSYIKINEIKCFGDSHAIKLDNGILDIDAKEIISDIGDSIEISKLGIVRGNINSIILNGGAGLNVSDSKAKVNLQINSIKELSDSTAIDVYSNESYMIEVQDSSELSEGETICGELSGATAVITAIDENKIYYNSITNGPFQLENIDDQNTYQSKITEIIVLETIINSNVLINSQEINCHTAIEIFGNPNVVVICNDFKGIKSGNFRLLSNDEINIDGNVKINDGNLILNEKNISPSEILNFGQIYSKTNKNLYYKDSSGQETKLNLNDLDFQKSLSTSLNYGGEISINSLDSTKFDINAGSAIFIDNYTDPSNPIAQEYSWENLESLDDDFLLTANLTFVYIDKTGTIIQLPYLEENQNQKEKTLLGVLEHIDRTNINQAVSLPQWNKDVLHQMDDIFNSIGSRFNINGNRFTYSGSNLNIKKTEGTIAGLNVNYNFDKKNPNIKICLEEDPLNFLSAYRHPAGNIFQSTTILDTNYYDPNGDGTLVEIPDNWYCDHGVFFEPTTNTTIVHYGQYIYDSLKKCIDSTSHEVYNVVSELKNVPLRSYICFKKGATDLSNREQASFVDVGTFGIKNFTPTENYHKFAHIEEAASGMSYERPSITYIDDGVEIYAEVESENQKNIIYVFEEQEFVLNCTSNIGTNGKAKVQLIQGTNTLPVENYIYVTKLGNEAILNASTTFPSGEFAWVGKVAINDITFFQQNGIISSQRYTDCKRHNGRGALSYEREKIRTLGVSYESGVIPIITIDQAPSPDSVLLSTSLGEVYQMHKSIFPAFDISTDGLYVLNDFFQPYKKITNINEIIFDSSGNTLNNRSFNLVFVGIQNTANGVNFSKLGVLLPNNSYGYTDLQNALTDPTKTAVTSVPKILKQTAFLIARITFKLKNDVWDNVTSDETSSTFFDLRGDSLGSISGGAGAPSVTQFLDSLFRVNDEVDSTKQLAFELSNLTTGNTRTLTVPDENGEILLNGRTSETFFNNNVGFGTNNPNSILHTFAVDLADTPLFDRSAGSATNAIKTGVRFCTSTTASAPTGFGIGPAFEFDLMHAGGTNTLGFIGGISDGDFTSSKLMFVTYNTSSPNTSDVTIMDKNGNWGLGLGINDLPTERLDVKGNINSTGYKINGTVGVSGSFTTTDGKTITINNGIVTNIV